MFYNSVFLLIGNEIGPRNAVQSAIASMLIIVGALLTGVLFGEMAVLSGNINRKSSKF